MKLKLSEIITKMAVLDEIDNPTKEDEKRLEELRAEFDKYLELPTTSPLLSDTGSDSEPEIKLYNRSNLDELRSFIRSKDKFGISEPFSAGKFIRSLISGDWSNAEVEKRAITTTTSGGGYLLPDIVASIIIPMALAKAQVFHRNGAMSIPMTDKFLTVPKIISMPKTEWKEEGVAFAEDTGMSFGGLLLEAKTLVSLIKISVELSQDSTALGVEQIIEEAMATSIGQEIDRAVLSGIGGLEPRGILNTEGILEEDLENNPIANFDFLSRAYFKLQAENEFNITALIAPSNLFRDLDLLKDATTLNPLKPPLSYEGTQQKPSYQKLSSNQLSDSAILGDFSKILVGFRTEMQIDVTDKVSDAFQRLEVWLRCFIRLDVGIKREKSMCHIKNFGEIAS